MNAKKKVDIFLVEDDKIFLLALKADIETTFKDMALKIHSFSTGEDCMAKFTQVMPQVVILDYYLNAKYPTAANGIKVLDWIKKETDDTDVIMLTSDDHIDIALESFHHGASDYVVKTSTKFKKINYSLTNIFKLIAARKEAKKYKLLIYLLSMGLAFLIGGLLAIETFGPSLLK